MKEWTYGIGLVHTSKDGRKFNGFVVFVDKSVFEYVQETLGSDHNCKIEHYVEPSGSMRIPYLINTKATKVGDDIMVKAVLSAKRARTM